MFGEHTLHTVEQDGIAGECRIGSQQRFRFLAGVLHERKVSRQIRNVQCGQAVLPLTEKVTRTALREVCACDLEAVTGPAQDAQALPLSRVMKMLS